MDCRIDRIEIVSFGKLQNRVIEPKDGLNVLSAPNESGKSTLAAFLRFVLYGFTDGRKKELFENDKKLYTPWDTPKCEGSVTVTRGDRQYRAYRSVTGNKEICTLTDVSTGRQLPDAGAPGLWLFGVGEDVFGRTLFFKQLTLPSGKDGVMAEQLQNIAVSADEQVGSRKAIDRLTKAKNELKGRAGSGIIPTLEKEMIRLEHALAEAKNERDEIDTLRAEHQKQQKLLANNADSQERVRDELQNLARFEASAKLAQLDALRTERDNAKAAYETAKTACKGATPDVLHDLQASYNAYEKAFAKAETAQDAVQNAPRFDAGETNVKKAGKGLMIAGIVLLVLSIALAVIFLPAGIALAAAGLLCTVLGLTKNSKQAKASQAEQQTMRQAAMDKQNALETAYELAKTQAEACMQTLSEGLLPFDIPLDENTSRAIYDLQNACHEADRMLAAAESASRAYEIASSGVDMDALRVLAQGAAEPIRSRSAVEVEQRFLADQARMVGEKANQIANRIAAIEGRASDPALLEGKYGAVGRSLDAAKQKYDAYEAARAGIEEAADEMKRMVAPRLGEIAGKYFAAATGGDYSGMEVDTRLAMTFEDKDGIVREIDYLSAGARDVAYLSLRLALAQLLYGGYGMPFVWDDAFGRLDDVRLAHVLRTLYAASQKHQTLLLCCTDREETLLAKENLPYTSIHLG